MKTLKQLLPRAALLVLIFTLLCGVVYTGLVTGLAQLFFPRQANGSLISVDGQTYGSALLGQRFTDERHMWGRVMALDVTTFTDETGRPVMYAWARNLSPASEEYRQLVAAQVEKIRAAHPEKGDAPIPVDLVTCSGSGLDPHISVAAATYQAERLAAHNHMTVDEVLALIDKYTTGRFLGVFGEPTVNVLQVNLALDGLQR